ncbi:pilus assembly protein [Vibrio tubiashii]|jgi:Flp pilus assembly protein TadG|uniref:TadE/TadG family type IV pilus assembly protein n=1 Tax=Vibrio tubiashii TaxID=29498 RepID=UPI001EFE7030|nr:TadE family protein [Vibrio tubiashii]MCG9575037.1 pilus assembly protein [Vibrio tubiashii]
MMNTKHRNVALAKNRGLAAVEMLIAIPVLLTILMAITEFGNAFVQYNTLNKMAQNGVRHATADILGTGSVNPCNNATTVSQTRNVVLYGKRTPGTSDLIMDGVTAEDVSITCANKYITITINHVYSPLIDSFASDISFDVPLIASAVMRTEP